MQGIVSGVNRDPESPPIRLYTVEAPHHVEATRLWKLARP